jgi:hypothetical protein
MESNIDLLFLNKRAEEIDWTELENHLARDPRTLVCNARQPVVLKSGR